MNKILRFKCTGCDKRCDCFTNSTSRPTGCHLNVDDVTPLWVKVWSGSIMYRTNEIRAGIIPEKVVSLDEFDESKGGTKVAKKK